MAERGWKFPPDSDPTRGRVRETSYEDMIRQSIHMIISTRRGERFLHPDFGCDVYDYIFQPIDYTTLKQIENEIIRSVKAWETRINDLQARAVPDPRMPHKVDVEISYSVPALSARLEQHYTLSGDDL